MITLGVFALNLYFGGDFSTIDPNQPFLFSGTLLLGSICVALFLVPFLTLFFHKSLELETHKPY
ncbi:hypothetical protein CWM42_26070, partial [Escherichia coli]